LGENFPPDELNQILQNGSHFGFPHCHGRNIPLDSRENCVGLVPSTFDLDPHCAALGMTFYSGSQFQRNFRTRYSSQNMALGIKRNLLDIESVF
jgi:glucose/arabinose dehydrogenase